MSFLLCQHLWFLFCHLSVVGFQQSSLPPCYGLIFQESLSRLVEKPWEASTNKSCSKLQSWILSGSNLEGWLFQRDKLGDSVEWDKTLLRNHLQVIKWVWTPCRLNHGMNPQEFGCLPATFSCGSLVPLDWAICSMLAPSFNWGRAIDPLNILLMAEILHHLGPGMYKTPVNHEIWDPYQLVTINSRGLWKMSSNLRTMESRFDLVRLDPSY